VCVRVTQLSVDGANQTVNEPTELRPTEGKRMESSLSCISQFVIPEAF
jgi:hypothetical protein